MSDELNKLNKDIYEFGAFRLIPSEMMLLSDGKPVTVTPKVFDALVFLVENAGSLVTKDEMLDHLWEDTYVGEAALAQTISRLRKTLKENPDDKYVKTVSKSGYRFVAPVQFIEKSSTNKVGLDKKSDPLDGSEIEAVGIFGKEAEVPEPEKNKWLYVGVGAVAVLFAGIFAWQYFGGSDVNSRDVKTLAVLPFKMLEQSEEDKALELGMADALIIKLSKLQGITVRPTSAISKYAGQNTDSSEIGKDLSVDAVIDGTIQKDGDRLRVSVRLLKSSDGSSLWAETFDSSSKDIFSLQDSISERVAQSLIPKLSGDERKQLAKRDTENPAAYEQYIKGRYVWSRRNPKDLLQALEFFQSAIKIDPNYAKAYAGIADCYQLLAEYRVMTGSEGFSKARTAARKALEIDENLSEAHASLGYTLAFYDWDFAGAEKEFKRSIELNPNYATAHQWYGELLTAQGRFDDAKAEIEKAEVLDPLSPIIRTNTVAYYYVKKQYQKSIDEAEKVIESTPNFSLVYGFQSLAYRQIGNDKEAIAAWIKSTELIGGKSGKELESLKIAEATGGWKGFWREWLKQMKANPKGFLSWDYAVTYLYLGEKDKALEWLEKSYKDRDRWIVNIKHNPQFESVSDDKRFKDIVNRIGR